MRGIIMSSVYYGNCSAGGDPWETDLIVNKPVDVSLLESRFCFKT